MQSSWENYCREGYPDDWPEGNPIGYCDRCGRGIYEDDFYLVNGDEVICNKCEAKMEEEE